MKWIVLLLFPMALLFACSGSESEGDAEDR
jgi:hypothetical protein